MRTGERVDRPRRELREGDQRAHRGDAQPHAAKGGGSAAAAGAADAGVGRRRGRLRAVPRQQTHARQDRGGAEDVGESGGHGTQAPLKKNKWR